MCPQGKRKCTKESRVLTVRKTFGFATKETVWCNIKISQKKKKSEKSPLEYAIYLCKQFRFVYGKKPGSTNTLASKAARLLCNCVLIYAQKVQIILFFPLLPSIATFIFYCWSF